MPQLHNLIEDVKKKDIWIPSFKKRLHEVNNAVFGFIEVAIGDAVCFDLGDSDDLPFLKTIPELFKFPYPTTWMEARLQDGILGVLAVTTNDPDGTQRTATFVFNKRLGIAWQLVGCGDVIALKEDVIFEPFDAAVLDKDPEQIQYVRDAVSIVVGRFLMALNCKNTHLVEHPAPKLINTKRKKKGKQPIYSYWTLHLPNESGGNRLNKGTHASPRVHLRRGHIRQYKPGKYTWVDACVVGEKANGIIDKDYKFSHDHTTH